MDELVDDGDIVDAVGHENVGTIESFLASSIGRQIDSAEGVKLGDLVECKDVLQAVTSCFLRQNNKMLPGCSSAFHGRLKTSLNAPQQSSRLISLLR